MLEGRIDRLGAGRGGRQGGSMAGSLSVSAIITIPNARSVRIANKTGRFYQRVFGVLMSLG
jgi:hypothetical protein